LHKNYPNPFNPSTTITFALDRQTDITLAIYNIRGEQVKLLARGTTAPGRYSVIWDGSTNSGSLATSGVYFYRLSDGQTRLTGKMMLIK
jgi:flagellar hook assembly protein FlgD